MMDPSSSPPTSQTQQQLPLRRRKSRSRRTIMRSTLALSRVTIWLALIVMILESIHDDDKGRVEAFHHVPKPVHRTLRSTVDSRAETTRLQMSDYLSSLNALGDLSYSGPLKKFPSRPHPSAALVHSNDDVPDVTLHHATRDYFNIDQLTPKGPRAGADAGAPHDATRPMVKDLVGKLGDNTLAAGSWWCAQGGWPSKTQRATTEIFYVFDGFGCLTDLDGKRNFFGPGSTVILPKGWSGRWDVAQDIHKVWFVHDHDKIEEDTSSTIRARIVNYHDMVSRDNLSPWKQRPDATHGTSPQSASKNFYDIGPTDVGFWTCTPGSFSKSTPREVAEGFYVLEGVFFLTNYADGTTQKCVAGDTVVLPKGWTGEWDIVETVQKMWVEV